METKLGSPAMQRAVLDQVRSSLKTLGADEATLKKFEPRANGRETPDLGELYSAAEQLGADSNLLAAIGSWGDTLSAQEVLERLEEWNEKG